MRQTKKNKAALLAGFSASGGLLDSWSLPVNDPQNDGGWVGIAAGGIKSATLVNTAYAANPIVSNTDYIVLDNLSYRVPAPGSLALMGVGLAAVARRRPKSPTQ